MGPSAIPWIFIRGRFDIDRGEGNVKIEQGEF